MCVSDSPLHTLDTVTLSKSTNHSKRASTECFTLGFKGNSSALVSKLEQQWIKPEKERKLCRTKAEQYASSLHEQILIKRYSAVAVGFFQYQAVPYQPTCSHTDKNEKCRSSGGCTLSYAAYTIQGTLHILETCLFIVCCLCTYTYLCLLTLWSTARSRAVVVQWLSWTTDQELVSSNPSSDKLLMGLQARPLTLKCLIV